MDIDRKKEQNEGIRGALHRLNFCLSRFEESNAGLNKTFEKRPIKDCSIEEMVGAMVSAEQEMLKMIEEIRILEESEEELVQDIIKLVDKRK